MKTYVVSDYHFFHRNILTFEPIRLQLGKTLEEMNLEIVKRHNEVVTPQDVVYNLGDVGFQLGSKKGELTALIKSMNGYKILIKGNHDTKPKEFYLELGFDEVYDEPILVDNIWLSHEPILDQDKLNGRINIHGHLHSNTHRSEETPTENLHLYRNVSIECLKDFKPVEILSLV